MAAFQRVSGWYDAGRVPVNDDPAGLPAVHVACVTVWSGGKAIGVGTSAGTTPAADRLAVAARQAFLGARRDSGELPARAEVSLSVELSDRLVPTRVDTAEELTLSFSPGMDGLCVALGDRAAAVSPIMLLARSAGPASQLGPLVTELRDGDVNDAFRQPSELRELGFTLYRFRVTHLVERGAGLGPTFAHRGGRVVGQSELDTSGLRSFAVGLADHLSGRRWPGAEPFGMVGTPDASTGMSEPAVAPPSDQAMTAIALLRLARVRSVPDEWRDGLVREVSGLLGALAEVGEGENDPATDGQGACLLVVLRAHLEQTPGGGAIADEHAGLFDRALEAVRARAVRETSGDALVAWALASECARLDRQLGDGETGPSEDDVNALNRAARETINAVLRRVPIEMIPGELPWLGWAAMALPRNGIEDTAPFLREARAAALRNQIRRADLDAGERDFAGGIVFTSGTTPLPTAQSARVAAFCASMLGHDLLTEGTTTEGEFPSQLVRTLETLRFMRQLAADDATAYLHARPEKAAWGVRSAMWDQTQPAQASALTLIAICDLLDAAQARAEDPAQQPAE